VAALVGLASGHPAREPSAHQVVQVPDIDDLRRAQALGEQARPDVQSPRSEDSLVNDIPQSRSKQMSKPVEETLTRSEGGQKNVKKGKKSNVEILHHLGMTKLRSPAVNHHRKRLASQSRKTHHQKGTSDSKMFVIKLPPNPYYYSHHGINGLDYIEAQPKSVNSPPVSFKSNGKPSKVYHWNVPVLKKMVARKAGSSAKSAVFADTDIFNIDKQATWNETDDDKALYRKATFYGPKKQSKHTFRKYFAGNGKPHSFYVMGKSKKPSSFYRLMP